MRNTSLSRMRSASLHLMMLGVVISPAVSYADILSARQLAERLTDPNALWNQVQVCLKENPLADPCMSVNRQHQYVILHDINPKKKDSYLIVPTFQVTGIEDPKAWKPPVADFWKYGWDQAKHYVGKPAEDTGLAINSIAGRDQNQLHIHISCVKKAVRDKLKTANIPATWKLQAVTLENHEYDAIKVASLDKSPFLVLQELGEAKRHMGDQSLAVVGASGGGYYLLDSYTTKGTKGEAEELLDEKCDR